MNKKQVLCFILGEVDMIKIIIQKGKIHAAIRLTKSF